MPLPMSRSCQRYTHVFGLPVAALIATVPKPSSLTRTMRPRQTCFCGDPRAATSASGRVLSDAAITVLSRCASNIVAQPRGARNPQPESSVLINPLGPHAGFTVRIVLRRLLDSGGADARSGAEAFAGAELQLIVDVHSRSPGTT
jgi:hypothetical protein